MTKSMNYWLMKSEPDVYSLEDLEQEGQSLWDGVRNYQARNFMKTMAIGDSVFFYHSNTKIPGIVGLMEVIENNVIDPTQFDPQSDYYDPKSSSENPRWQTVKVKFVRAFPKIVSLDQLKQTFASEELLVVKKGNRLSVIPIATNIAEKILLLV